MLCFPIICFFYEILLSWEARAMTVFRCVKSWHFLLGCFCARLCLVCALADLTGFVSIKIIYRVHFLRQGKSFNLSFFWGEYSFFGALFSVFALFHCSPFSTGLQEFFMALVCLVFNGGKRFSLRKKRLRMI